ncbi:MAG: hypothetical protein EPN93_13545 [Spirochaetes bacterium]|nr:MAG: hypothetical protein EPN93_13545 [Spirochaetota bacterium]
MKKLFAVALIAALALLCAPPLRAGEPTKDPILRLNTGMHTGALKRMDVDAQGKYMVSCADDKIAILWDARTGEALRTLRPPIDAANEGKLFSCAISRDGKTIATGGWTGYDWYGNNTIYLFNAQTGEMTGRIPGLENVINDIEFSPDGKYLAASLGRANGVRIFDTSTWKLVHALKGYGDNTYSVAFDRTGRFASVSYDGNIRLYGAGFKLVKEMATTGGRRPFNLAFSPDGAKIAVGYDDTWTVQVLDGYSLEVLYEPDVTGSEQFYKFDKVCWSLDGSYLYGVGGYSLYRDNTWWRVIRRWSDGGRGGYQEFNGGLNNIMDIKTLPDDSLIFGSAFPDVGRMDRAGTMKYFVKGATNDFRAKDQSHFKLNANGTVTGFTPFGKKPLTFSIEQREVVEKGATFGSPKQSAGGTTVTDWANSQKVKLNGAQISFLEDYELSRSLDIADSGDFFIIGADWSIYCMDRSGSQLWKVTAPGVAWAVNIADDARTVAILFGDGTVRWFSTANGQELLSLFVHAENRTWVIWTPSGYYDCSPGGQDLIGWHINNGIAAAADFYPVSRFAQRFYRPDVIQLVLKTASVDQALAQANKDKGLKGDDRSIVESLPPVVTIISPESGYQTAQDTVELTLLVKTPENDPVTEIKVLVNGRPSKSDQRGITLKPKAKAGERKTVMVSVEEGENEISALAKNSNGFSVPSTIKVTFTKPNPQEFVIKPKLYILAVGVSMYEDPELKLNFASKDAGDFAGFLKSQQGSLYREVTVKVLIDAGATKDEVLDGLDWISKETTSKDVAMIFFAGHGVNDSTGIYYFLPVNANREKLKRTAVPFTDIKNTVASLAGKALFFVDTCHSGNVMGSRRGVTDITGVVNELASSENGVIVFASSTGSQYSLESPDWANGAFTKALIEGMNGGADYQRSGRITVNMLDLYISERVKELTGGKQTPTTTKPQTVPDFPVIVR